MSSITTTLQAMGSAQAVDESVLAARGGWRRELNTLGLTPLVAVATEEWTGTLTGQTTGSTTIATSSDATVLTVDGAEITGTFATGGSKTVTVTETLAGATNTPNAKTFTVVVS